MWIRWPKVDRSHGGWRRCSVHWSDDRGSSIGSLPPQSRLTVETNKRRHHMRTIHFGHRSPHRVSYFEK